MTEGRMANEGPDKAAVFVYLDDLRQSGVTNMFGATPYIMEEYGVEERVARALLVEWMDTFAERHPRA